MVLSEDNHAAILHDLPILPSFAALVEASLRMRYRLEVYEDTGA